MTKHSKEPKLKEPYIPSQLSAFKMAEKWYKENDFSHIVDAGGHHWNAKFSHREEFNNKNRR